MLKNIALAFALTFLAFAAFSQDELKTDFNKHAFRVGWDFNNPQFGMDQTGLNSSDNYTSGLEFAYIRGFTNNFNLAFPLTFASNRYLDEEDLLSEREEGYLGLDILGQLLITSRKYVFSPYLFGGIGGEWQFFNDNQLTGTIPLGIGLDWNVKENLFVGARGGYRLGLNNADYLQLNVGLTAMLGKLAPKEVPVIFSDLDGDGIDDKEDECPAIAGIYAFNGCPDTDKDGVQDSKDECPEIAGLIELNGCPLKDSDGDGVTDDIDRCPSAAGPAVMKGCPDSDGDGISDADDLCPDQPGVRVESGCPEKSPDADGDGFADDVDKCPSTPGALNGCPDSDLDGVADANDKCPNKPGAIANNGCPELQEAEKAILQRAKEAIEFETSSARIRSSSRSILNEIVALLKKYPSYHVKIGGHTDSIGEAATNQKLSEKRAKACYDYLVKNGISASRLSYNGYGEKQPIATNMYKDGRKKNRRVEFDMFIP